MAQTSFVQTDFRGGKWSARAQGKMHDQRYKTALNISTNGLPVFNGPWTRRPGFFWGGNTRGGAYARLVNCYLKFSEPFQLELSNFVLRPHIGNGWVFTNDTGVTIKSISAAKPAVVTTYGTLPSGWANGDTVTLVLNQPAKTGAQILAGRQFMIGSISTNTFALYDPMTLLPIDGSTFSYTAASTGKADQVFKLLELTTPWSQSVVDQVQIVSTDAYAWLFQKTTRPQSLTVPPVGNFALAEQKFADGPYMNINTTATTLTPSGTSGSITVTASTTTNINGGFGFLATDVGRMLRLQTGPGAWSSGTTYNVNALVVGSDGNVYISQIGSNTNNDPTLDTGTHWVVTGQSVVWVWGYITAVTDTTHVTLSIQPAAVVGRTGAAVTGDTIPSGWTGATTGWQLGLFSDTTGWPAGGTYHEGRLWLYGGPVSNRIDGSQVNPDPTLPFNFAPSAPDGTVGDGSAIAAVMNFPDINQVFWMLPTNQGILIGTQAGEAVVRPSQLGDPITPTSIQVKRVSTYGCANIQALQTELTTCFVQREQKRVMNYANYPYGEAAGWFADNLSENADDLVGVGVAEIRWQQEPSHFLWCRGNDGSLFGTTFEHAAYGKESYNGWHGPHPLGGNRAFTSISTGPSADGLTTTLYAIALNKTTGLYEYLVMAPLFDASQQNWAQNFTDGVAAALPAQERLVANGDLFNGVQFYGMGAIVGQTVTVAMGGLDLGDWVVQADGSISIPFSGSFTQGYYQGLSNGTNYGVFALAINPSDPNVYNHVGFGAYQSINAGGNDTRTDLSPLIDPASNRMWTLSYSGVSNTFNGLRKFNLKTLALVNSKNFNQIFNNALGNYALGVTVPMCYHPDTNSLYMNYSPNGSAANSLPVGRFDADSLLNLASFGSQGSSFTVSATNIPALANSIVPVSGPSGPFVAAVFEENATNNNGIAVLDAITCKLVATAQITQAGELQAYLCRGPYGIDTWYAIGTTTYSGNSTQPIGIYTCNLTTAWNFTQSSNTVTLLRTGQITPAQVDATWTHFNNVTGPAFDPTDGNIILYVSTGDVVTHTAYWIKVNPNTAALVWAFADTAPSSVPPINAQCMNALLMPNGHFKYMRNGGGGTIYTLQTDGSALATQTYSATTTVFNNQTYWPQTESLVISAQAIFSGSPPGPYDSGVVIPLGAYMLTSASYSGWSLITNAAPTTSANWPPPDQYNIPLSIGVNYTSIGQLLRPDFGQDAGAQAGPAFAKKRRNHWFGASVERSQTFQIGTDNTFALNARTDTVIIRDQDENLIAQPSLYTGILSDTLPDDYTWESMICWRVTRPVSLTITALGGFLATQDK